MKRFPSAFQTRVNMGFGESKQGLRGKEGEESEGVDAALTLPYKSGGKGRRALRQSDGHAVVAKRLKGECQVVGGDCGAADVEIV